MSGWIDVCDAEDIDLEDVIRFDHGGRTFAVYRTLDGAVFATDGLCTHEKVHLADGLVMDDTIECPQTQRALQLPDWCGFARSGLRGFGDLSRAPARWAD